MSRIAPMAGVYSALEIAASGLTAERGRMNVIASNLANARTTKSANGGPYRRIDPLFAVQPLAPGTFDPVLRSISTVQLSGTRADASSGQLVFEPGNPDANPQGYVEYPNVNVVTEMVNMMTASRAYEAGVTSIESIKAMANAALKIGQ